MQAPSDPPEIYTWNSWVIVHRGKCVQAKRLLAAVQAKYVLAKSWTAVDEIIGDVDVRTVYVSSYGGGAGARAGPH